MHQYCKSSLAATAFLIAVIQPGQVKAQQQEVSIQTVVLNESKLRINGTSNVTDFECKYNNDFEVDTLSHHLEITEDSVLVSGDDLPLIIDSFDCGKRAINKDFKSTLKSKEYPNIDIKLLEVYSENGRPKRASVAISLGGATQQYLVSLTEEIMGNEVVAISGTQKLKLSDFNLEPPRALFGLIKVRDELDVSFELLVKPGKTQ